VTRDEEIEAAWQQHLSRWSIVRTPELRERLAEAQNWRCCYCGCEMVQDWRDPLGATFEHVIPLSKGGLDTEENLAIACWTCNNKLGIKLCPQGYKYSWHINSVITNRDAYNT